MTANKRVPNSADSSLTVVQASTGDIVATISANASLLSGPTGASFDGEQVPVANSSGNSVTLFKAADLSVLGDVTTRLQPAHSVRAAMESLLAGARPRRRAGPMIQSKSNSDGLRLR